MTNILTFPTRRKFPITTEQLALIQNDYIIMATSLEQLRDHLVDLNNQLKDSCFEISDTTAPAAPNTNLVQKGRPESG